MSNNNTVEWPIWAMFVLILIGGVVALSCYAIAR